MPDKRLLYFTSLRAIAYRWKGGTLTQEATFSIGEDGVAAFSQYVAAAPGSLFYILADIVEEDFFQENIPYVRGADRRTLLARKLAQRYRDTTLALALSLGTETEGRREERVLFSSFTNTQQFQPWLAALRSNQARVAGVYSVALTAPLAGKCIGVKAKRYLLVSLQQGGLRQSFVENGRIRFSRLGRIDFSDPRAVAQSFAEESARIQQYLINARMLERDAPLDAIVLAPGKYKALYDAACVNAARLQFHVFDLDRVGRRAGLKSAPAEMLAEGLYLHLLASSRVGEQYADDGLRRFYDLWRARVGLIAAGAAAFALCLALSGLKLFDVSQINQQAEADRRLEAVASRQYASTRARFPPTPTSTESLKAITKNYLSVLRQSATPAGMLVEISQALASSPQIELEKIDWGIGTPKAAAGGRDVAPPPPGGPAPAAELRYQVAEISGRLFVPQASDYRNITTLVNQFVEALRSRPGMEVVSTRLPFDINAEKSLSGDIGVERGTEVPRFSVVVSKRLGI